MKNCNGLMETSIVKFAKYDKPVQFNDDRIVHMALSSIGL